MLNPRILIIEDIPDIAVELEERIKLLGYTLAGVVSTVGDAFELMERQPVDVILMDVHKIGWNGKRLAEEIHSRFGVPVINLVSDTVTTEQTEPFFVGPPGHWLKPFHEWELRAAIEAALRLGVEQRLEESEARNRALLNANPDLMFLMDRNGTYIDLHVSDPGLLYMPANQVLGKNIRDVLPPEPGNKIIDAIQNVIDNKGEQIIEYPLLVNNENRFFEARVVRCTEQTALSLVRDITERKRSENALRASETKYRKLVNDVNDGFYTSDLNGRLSFVNRALVQMLGYKDGSQLLGRRIVEIMKTSIPLGILKYQYRTALNESNGSAVVEIDFLRSDGSRIFLEVKPQIIFEDGKPAGTQGVIREITEKKLTEQILRESENKYRRLVESSPDIVYIFSNQRGGLYYSPRVEEVLGYSIEQLSGNPFLWNEAVHPDDRERAAEAVSKAAFNQSFDIEYRIRDAHGNWRWFRDRSFGHHTQNGETIIEGLASDITEQKKTEETIREYAETYLGIKANDLFGFWLVDERGIIDEVNDQYLSMSGYTRDEVVNVTVSKFDAVDDNEVVRSRIERVMKSGREYFDTKHRKKDGTVFDVEVNLIYLQNQRKFISFIRDITERKRAEEILQQSEQRFRNLMEASPDGIVVVDSDGNITTVNPMIKMLFGYSGDELLGQPVEILLPKRSRTNHISYRSEYQDSPHVRPMGANMDLQALHKDGSEFPVEVSLSPLIMNGEKLIISVVRDITERRRTEKILAENERLYRTFFELSPIGILLEDTQGNILEVNDAFCKSLGYSADELIGMKVHMLAAPEHIKNVDDDIAALVSGKRLEHIVEDIKKDGTKRLVELRESLVSLPGGREGILVVASDITEQRQAAIKLEESEKKYRTLLENIPQKVFYKDRHSKYVAVNPSYARDFGLELEEFPGLTDDDIFPPDIAKKYRADDLRVIKTGQMEEHDETYLKEGDERIIHTVKVPVTDPNGDVTGILGIFWDITERKRVEEQLRHLSLHDAQTGLYNRGYFDDTLQKFERSRQFPISLVVADIDGLKDANDRSGHAVGDMLIQRAARILVAAFRTEDIIARTGGDEFYILLPNTDMQAAKSVLKRVRRMIQEHNATQDIPLRLSLGLSTAEKRTSLLKILKDADTRMYREKRRRKAAKSKRRTN